MTLTVVPLHPDRNPGVASLYDQLDKVIDDYCANSTVPVTSAEIVGTIEFLKLAHMKVYDR